MAGIFLSYSRADREHAYRIVQGFRALGVDVWWDEDMPGVDWQYELEQRISDMAAVLVLWSKNSRNSPNVRDEARLADKKNKLINALIGIEEPPHPYDRKNGLPVDGWDGHEPHRGWARLVQTAETFIVAAGGAEPRSIVASLAEVERNWQSRKQAFAQAQEAFGEAQTAAADMQEATATAAAELEVAQVHLAKAGEMRFPLEIISAAKELCDSRARALAEAEAAHRLAKTKLAEASRAMKRCSLALQETVRELPASPITPTQPKPSTPEPASAIDVDPPREEERSADVQPPAGEEKLHQERPEADEPQAAAKDKVGAEPVEQDKPDAAAETPSPAAPVDTHLQSETGRVETARKTAQRSGEAGARPQVTRGQQKASSGHNQLRLGARLAILAGVLIILSAVTTMMLYPAKDTDRTVQPAPKTPPLEQPKAIAAAPPPGEWLIGEWVMDRAKAGNCKNRYNIARGKTDMELIFTNPDFADASGTDRFEVVSDSELKTSTWRYTRKSDDVISMQNLDDNKDVRELTKCV